MENQFKSHLDQLKENGNKENGNKENSFFGKVKSFWEWVGSPNTDETPLNEIILKSLLGWVVVIGGGIGGVLALCWLMVPIFGIGAGIGDFYKKHMSSQIDEAIAYEKIFINESGHKLKIVDEGALGVGVYFQLRGEDKSVLYAAIKKSDRTIMVLAPPICGGGFDGNAYFTLDEDCEGLEDTYNFRWKVLEK